MNVVIAVIITAGLMGFLFLVYLLDQRIRRIEQDCKPARGAIRQTQSTEAAILDSVSVLLDIERDAQDVLDRCRTAREILGITRQGPYAYDTDRPAGKRLK